MPEIIKYVDVKETLRLTVEAERQIWLDAMHCLDDGYVRPERKSDFLALINNAPVIIHRDDEILGLYTAYDDCRDDEPDNFVPTKNDDRYLWLSFMTSGEYADQACIADEYSASEFEAQQEP